MALCAQAKDSTPQDRDHRGHRHEYGERISGTAYLPARGGMSGVERRFRCGAEGCGRQCLETSVLTIAETHGSEVSVAGRVSAKVREDGPVFAVSICGRGGGTGSLTHLSAPDKIPIRNEEVARGLTECPLPLGLNDLYIGCET